MIKCFYCKEPKELTIRSSKPEEKNLIEAEFCKAEVVKATMIDVCIDCWHLHLSYCQVSPIIIGTWEKTKRFVQLVLNRKAKQLNELPMPGIIEEDN